MHTWYQIKSYCFDRTNHIWGESYWNDFSLEKPLNIQNLMGCCRKLEDNSESTEDDGGLAFNVTE